MNGSPNPAPASAPRPASEHPLFDAIAQLSGSWQGRQAMADLYELLNHGGTGLDANNWRAIGILVAAAARGDVRSVLALVEPYRPAIPTPKPRRR